MADLLKPLTETPRPDTLDALRPELPTPNTNPVQENIEYSFGNEFTKGFRRGLLGLAGTSIAAGGQIAETVGAKEKAASMFDEARRLVDFPQGLRPKVETWDDVNDTGSFIDYGLSKAGEAAPSTIGSIAAAGVGGAAGLGLRAAGMRALGPNTMGYAAGAGSMLAPEVGESALTMQNDPQAMANTTPAERLAIAGGKGAVNAALEFLPERMALGRAFTRPVGKAGLGALARGTAYGAAEGAVGEAATEATQEFTGQLAHGFANPQRDTSQDLVALREAALGGAFGGAPMGATAGLVQGARTNVQGALERGKGAVESAQEKGKLPTVADIATFMRRTAEEPEYFGEKAGEVFNEGKEVAKRGWQTVGELATKATDKSEAIVAEANETLKGAIASSPSLDQPDQTANREFLLKLQDNVGAMSKDVYFTLKDIIANPKDAFAQEKLGYFAKGFTTEALPKAKQRSMDWISRTTEGFKRGVDKKIKASLEWTDAKDAVRKTLGSNPDFKAFRGLKLAEQRAVVGAMFAARETPNRVTPEARKAFEDVMGQPIEAIQAYADGEQQTRAQRVEKEYRAEMVKKITAARKDIANLARNDNEGTRAAIAKKYGLTINEIEDGVGTSRTEATFDTADEGVVAAELEDLDRTREGTPPEIEPPMDPEISQEVLGNSIQNLHYLRQDEANTDPESPRAHLWVTLRADKNDPKAPTPREILESFSAEDSMYTGGTRRKFTEEEVARFTNEDGSVRLPIRPMSLSAEMQRNKSTKDALDPIRKGQTGGSLSRKGDLLMTGLSTLMNTGLKWKNSAGVEHTLQVEPEFEDVPVEVGPRGQIVQKVAEGTVARTERRLPRNVLVGAAPSKKKSQDRHANESKAQTIDAYLNEKPAWTPRSAEALTAEREVMGKLREAYDSLDSYRFSDYVKGLKETLTGLQARSFGRWNATRAEKANKYIEEAKQQAADNEEELTEKQAKELENEAWRRASDEAITEIGNSNLRATVNDGLKTIFEDVQALALDRLEAGFRTVAQVEGLIRYLETNGEEVSPEVNALFRENNIRLFTPAMLNDPALQYDDGGTPQERYINQLEWLKQRAEESERSGLYAQAEGNDQKGRLDETSNEVPGVGNTVWDQGSFTIPAEPVTAETKTMILRAFTEYTKQLAVHGKFRVQSPGKKKFKFGFFKTEKDAKDWLASLPAEGVKGLRIKVEGVKQLLDLDAASARWPWKEFEEESKSWEKGFRTNTQKAQIINPDTGEFLAVGNVEFAQMSPYLAVAHLKELSRMVYDAQNATVIDGTPMFTWTPPQPVRKASESDDEYMTRVRALVKPTSQPLTYNQLDKLISTREVSDPNSKSPLAKPAVDPQAKLDLQDDVMAEENKVEPREPAPPRPTEYQALKDNKQATLDLFETPDTPKAEVERWYQIRNKAGLSGETTTNPMYLWKRSVVRARREQAPTPTVAEKAPEAAPEPKKLKEGRVRTDITAPVSVVRDKNAVQGKGREELDATPARDDDDLLGFSRLMKKLLPPAVGRTAEPNRITGDIWDQDGYKIITTNLGGVHGRGLAKQAKDKGLIDWKNREFGASPFDKKIITLAVKGKAPETRTPGKGAWSEQVTGGNIDLLKSELRKLLTYARKNPTEKFYLPYAGLGFGEGDPAVITPMLEWIAKEPNIFLISRGDEVQQRYPQSFQPGARRDATTRTEPVQPAPVSTEREQAPRVNATPKVAATESEYSPEAMRRRLERDVQLSKEASEYGGDDPVVVTSVGAHGETYRKLTPEQVAARAGQDAKLVRETDKAVLDKDPNAIKVMHNGVHHTYVPRSYTKDMVANREKGYTYSAKFDSTGKYLIIKRAKPEAKPETKVREDSDLTNDEKAEQSMPEDTRLPEDDEIAKLNTPHERGPKEHFVPMKYKAEQNELREGLRAKYPKGATMLTLIANEDRTATTRSPQDGIRKGDTIKFAFSNNRYEVTGFERVKFDKAGMAQWEAREGWDAQAAHKLYPAQVKSGAIQMTFSLKSEKPTIKSQKQKAKEPDFVGPPEGQAGPPQPDFIGPPTARDLGIFKKEQEQAKEVPAEVPKKLIALVEKMFGKKVQILIGEPKGVKDGTAWYMGRKQLNEYKQNMQRLQEVRSARREALFKKEIDRANELRAEEEELLKQTQVLGLIYLSPKLSEADQLGAFYHEAVHAMFDILLNPDERAALGAAFSQGLVRNKLRQIFKDDPEVLSHMEDAEEAAAYAFQVWAVNPEKLPLGGKVRGIFNHIQQFIRKLFGLLTPEEKAQIIFNDMLTGKRAETGLSSLQKVLDKDMTFNERVIKTAREMSQLVRKGWNVLATSNYERLMLTGNPAIQKIAQLGYTKTGEARDPGMVQKWFQQNTAWLNKLDKSMKNFKPEAVAEAMEARIHDRKPKGAEAKQAYNMMSSYFDEMYQYFNSVIENPDHKLKFRKNYFPIMWNPEKVMKDREGFLKMINKPEYAGFIEELKVTPNELWEHISGYLIRGEKFQNVINANTGEPVNDFASERSLSFLTPEDMRPYLEDDPVHVMLHYTKHMVRHAEYIRAFGVKGAGMIELQREAEDKYGATKDQMALVSDYVDGLLGNREVGMPRELKDVYGAMVVYQNFRLLPFSLFSSLVDPLGIAVRSNRIGDAVETFGYSMKNIFRDLKKREDVDKDYWERLAEDWGIIEDAQVLSNIHHMYESVELRGMSKRLNEALFKYNLLEGWVRSTKIMATKSAQRFIYRASKDQLGKDSERYLDELGLKKSDVVADDKGNMAITRAELEAQGVSPEQAKQIEKRLQDATLKFVNQSVLNPTAADLPNWGSNPYFAPIFHLKQFMFTFQNVILARIGHEMQQGNYKPLWTSTIFIPGMIAADAIRGFVSNFGDEPPWQKDWGASDYLLNGVERSGLLGTGALFVGMKDDMMHGGSGYESLAGPSVEQLRKGVKATQGGDGAMQNFAVKSMPLNPIYDQWFMSSGGSNAS